MNTKKNIVIIFIGLIVIALSFLYFYNFKKGPSPKTRINKTILNNTNERNQNLIAKKSENKIENIAKSTGKVENNKIGEIGKQEKKPETKIEEIGKIVKKSREECKAMGLNTKEDIGVEIGISENKNIGKILKDSIFSIEEIENSNYGFKIDNSKIDGYIASEICQGKRGLSLTDLDSDSVKLFPGGVYSNFVQFNNQQCHNPVVKTIQQPGKYQLYIYGSSDKKHWHIIKKFEFKVK